MPFEYVDDGVTSDVTFHAWAGTLDDLFAAAVDATTGVMVADLDTVRPLERREVEIAAEALDLLLWQLLDEVVFIKDADGILVRAAAVTVDPAPSPPRLRAILAGERVDPARHALAADLKAVTLYGLKVERRNVLWHAEVTLDV